MEEPHAKADPERLEAILERALRGRGPEPEELAFLLALREEAGLTRLFETARLIRRRHFGRRVFLYGFALFSTHCRNDCAFCNYRVSNRERSRYRKSNAEILEAALALAQAGVHLIDLTMGEDPLFHQNGERGFERLVGLVEEIALGVGLPVMVSPGVLPGPALKALAQAGADWYACYQETHNRELFARLRTGQDYQARMEAKQAAQKAGLLIEEGVLCGVGESPADLACSIAEMRDLGADQVRAMAFVPQPGTPLALANPPDPLAEPVALAVMRLALPDRLIPATLDVDGLAGLRARLTAGANVVTSMVPPGRGWAGVANCELDIDEARRTPEAVARVLDRCGLSPASAGEYRAWLRRRRSLGGDPTLQPTNPLSPIQESP